MSIDLSRLTPAPWTADIGATMTDPYDEPYDWFFARGPIVKKKPPGDAKLHAGADAAFIAMARNAFAGDPEALAWWEANRKKVSG